MLKSSLSENKELIAFITIGSDNEIKDLKLSSQVKLKKKKNFVCGKKHRIPFAKPKRHLASRGLKECASGSESNVSLCGENRQKKRIFTDNKSVEMKLGTANACLESHSGNLVHLYPPNFALSIMEIDGSEEALEKIVKCFKRNTVTNKTDDTSLAVEQNRSNSKELQNPKNTNNLSLLPFEEARKTLVPSYCFAQFLERDESMPDLHLRELSFNMSPFHLLPNVSLLAVASWIRMCKNGLPRIILQNQTSALPKVRSEICHENCECICTRKSCMALKILSPRNHRNKLLKPVKYGEDIAQLDDLQEDDLAKHVSDLFNSRGSNYCVVKTKEYSELKELIKIKENLLLSIQDQVSCLYVEFARKTHMMQKWENEINYLYLSLNEREVLVKNINEKNAKLYELERRISNYKDAICEKDYILKSQKNKVDELQNNLNEANLYILELKNVQMRKDVTAQFLHTLQRNLATELKEKEVQCEKLELNLIEVKGGMEELQKSNESLQLQLKEMQNCNDVLLEEKEALERKFLEAKKISTTAGAQEAGVTQMDNDQLIKELENQKRMILCLQDTITKLDSMNEDNENQIQLLIEQNNFLKNEHFNFSYDSDERCKAAMKLDQLEIRSLKSQVKDNRDVIDRLKYLSDQKDGRLHFIHTILITLQNKWMEEEAKAKAAEQVEKQPSIDRRLSLMGKKLNRLQKDLESKQLEVSLLDKELKSDRQAKESKKLCVDNLRNQIVNLQKKLHDAVVEKNEKNLDIMALRSQMQAIQKNNRELEADVEEKANQIDQLKIELLNMANDVEVNNNVTLLHDKKAEKTAHQINNYRIELDKREVMINAMQTMINQHQQSEAEKNALINRLCIKVAKCESCYEKFPLVLQKLLWEIKRLKEKGPTLNDLETELAVFLNKAETELRSCHLNYMYSKCKGLAKSLHILTQEKLDLQRKYNDKVTIRNQLELQGNLEETRKAAHYKICCLDMEMAMLQELIVSKDREMLDLTKQQRKVETDKNMTDEENQ